MIPIELFGPGLGRCRRPPGRYGYRHGPKEVLDAVARGEAIDPTQYYMRTHARLETGDPRYDWVNKTLFVGIGARLQTTVYVDLYSLD